LAEWSNAAVLKTVDCNRSVGSNPTASANFLIIFYYMKNAILAFAMAAVAVSCTQASEEVSTETIVDSTAVELDSLEAAAYEVEGEDASAE